MLTIRRFVLLYGSILITFNGIRKLDDSSTYNLNVGFPLVRRERKRTVSRKAKYQILAFSLTCLGIVNAYHFATDFGFKISFKNL